MLATLAFSPIILFIALAFGGLCAAARLVLSWALSD
jgi:hypothetical protein